MALSYAIGPNPKWYFVDNTGRPLAGGKFYTYRSLDKSVKKFVYTDPSNNFPWPDPVILDANGTAGPFFFEIDSTDPNETYFILVTDANGVEMWSVDHYLPSGGSGGGGTTAVDLDNLVKNNIFYRHMDTTTGVPTFSIVAPSNNSCLTENGSLTANAAPNICFFKNNATATDSISFPLFPLGLEPITGDSSPVDYFNYTCSVAGAGETDKYLQFPICPKVQNLSGSAVTGSFWAKSSTSSQVILQWFQFFGDGAGASAPIIQQINVPFSLTPTWTKYNFIDAVPSVSGKSLGGPPFGGPLHNTNEGPNDALFLRVSFPLSPLTCNVDLTKVSMYLGTALPNLDFVSYDEIDAIISSPKTGDVRMSMNSFSPYGWVLCNDGVIANGNNAIALPAGVPSARNNEDTYSLYRLIWAATSANPAYAPIYDSAGAVSVRGASAIADFSASKQLSLTKALGRALSSAGQASNVTAGVVTPFGTAWGLGQNNIGEQTHALTIAEMPAHTHPPLAPNIGYTGDGSGGGLFNGGGNRGDVLTTGSAGSSVPHSLMQPTSFWNVFLKL